MPSWALVAVLGAVYWERIADRDAVIRTELDGWVTIPVMTVSPTGGRT